MTLTRALVLSIALGGCGAAVTPLPHRAGTGATAPTPTSIADAAFLEQYAATMGFRLGQPASIQVTRDGSAVLFLRSGPRSFERDLYQFDVATGEERVLLTAQQILEGGTEELSPEERARRERMRLSARGIATYVLSSDGSRILVPLSGKLFVVERQTGRAREIGTERGYPNEARFSPDGTKVACVRDGDLYVIDVASGRERRLTTSATEHVTNGIPEFVAQEEMGRFEGYWWSPDGAQIVYQQTDTRDVETLRIVDPMHPEAEVHQAPYPRPGRNNARVKLGIMPARGGATRWIDWDRDALPYLVTVRWSDGAPLTVVLQNRAQTELRVATVDARSLAVREIFVERDPAWLNIDQHVPRWIEGGAHFLWSTERDGAWVLEKRSADGSAATRVTEASLGYETLVRVDAQTGWAWVLGSDDPTARHVYRVPLAGGAPVAMSDAAGVHSAHVGGEDVWVRESHAERELPRWTVMRGDQPIAELRSAAETPPFLPSAEYLTVGERELNALVIRPRNFEPSRSYPVLVSVYGGPGHAVVRRDPMRLMLQQWYADHGFIVVSVDGRGTPGRGRQWERAIHGNFIRRPLEDQVAGVRALGARFSEMDMTRVGIWGWSFGGYFSAMAVMREPDVFHAGVAGAPVADWSDYDTHYTERFIGLPDENAEGYEDGSVLTHAPRLTRPLLVIHGTADDNVYFTHAIKMSDALLRAGRDHDFLPLSGFTHMVAEPTMTRNLHDRIIQFFGENLSAR